MGEAKETETDGQADEATEEDEAGADGQGDR